ncbi:RHS repeat-associated core domain-containing protein, partial [Streptomyces sp. NPDC001107]
ALRVAPSSGTGNGTLTWLMSDPQNSSQLTIAADTGTAGRRRYLPFGAQRTGSLPTSTDRGFLGKTEDDSTGLSILGARAYDPTLGRFLTTDPLSTPYNPQGLNAYTYAGNNPLTFSDPSGLRFCADDACRGDWVDTQGGYHDVDGNDSGSSYCETHKCYGPSGGGNGQTLSDATHDAYDQAVQLYSSGAPPVRNSSNTSEAEYDEAARLYDSPSGSLSKEAALQLWFYGLSRAQIDYVLNNYCEFLQCNGTAAALLSGHLTESPFHDYSVQDTVTSSLLAGEGYRGSRSACNHSFISQTEVLMADGRTKEIQDIRAGDKVLATDPDTGKTTAREVVDTITTKDDKDFVEVAIDTSVKNVTTGSVIATTTHPFWSPSKRAWIDAGDLHPGMTLRTEDGHQAKIATVRHFTKHQITHDLTVSSVHTYYVLAGETPVLVHNCGGIGRELLGDDAQHILDGHAYPGLPGKTVFPKGWSDDDILDAVADVATNPNSTRVWKTGSANYAERTLRTRKGDPAVQAITGEVRGVSIEVRYEPLTGRVLTAFPK